jgi:hypothetical protein
VIATLKKDKGGVRKLTLSYTGTTAEAEAARKKGKEVEEESPAIETSNRIRDLTGSGEEHLPEQVSPSPKLPMMHRSPDSWIQGWTMPKYNISVMLVNKISEFTSYIKPKY